MEKTNPIGIFDSGAGGISVLACIHRLMPEENLVFFADTANAPYGTKTGEKILQCSLRVFEELRKRSCKAVVIACNTATAAAAAYLRSHYQIPIIGMEPALKPAHEKWEEGVILVMATPLTLNMEKFARLMEQYGEHAIPVPCPGLMELVEKEDSVGAEAYLKSVLRHYSAEKIDSVVLGCTHYVFLRDLLVRLLPAGVKVIDGNLGTARQLRHILEENDLRNPETDEGFIQLMTSGDESLVIPHLKRLLDRANQLQPY